MIATVTREASRGATTIAHVAAAATIGVATVSEEVCVARSPVIRIEHRWFIEPIRSIGSIAICAMNHMSGLIA